jgi:hypothetical protein
LPRRLPYYNILYRYWIVTATLRLSSRLRPVIHRRGSGDPMRIPPTGYLTLALLCGELICVTVWAFTGIFFVLVVGIAAGIGSVVAAMRWED